MTEESDLDFLYEDLEVKESESERELRSENARLSQENESLKERLSVLLERHSKRLEENRILSRNLSSLIKTARLEVNRKNGTITELKKKLDDLVFKRSDSLSAAPIVIDPKDLCPKLSIPPKMKAFKKGDLNCCPPISDLFLDASKGFHTITCGNSSVSFVQHESTSEDSKKDIVFLKLDNGTFLGKKTLPSSNGRRLIMSPEEYKAHKRKITEEATQSSIPPNKKSKTEARNSSERIPLKSSESSRHTTSHRQERSHRLERSSKHSRRESPKASSSRRDYKQKDRRNSSPRERANRLYSTKDHRRSLRHEKEDSSRSYLSSKSSHQSDRTDSKSKHIRMKMEDEKTEKLQSKDMHPKSNSSKTDSYLSDQRNPLNPPLSLIADKSKNNKDLEDLKNTNKCSAQMDDHLIDTSKKVSDQLLTIKNECGNEFEEVKSKDTLTEYNYRRINSSHPICSVKEREFSIKEEKDSSKNSEKNMCSKNITETKISTSLLKSPSREIQNGCNNRSDNSVTVNEKRPNKIGEAQPIMPPVKKEPCSSDPINTSTKNCKEASDESSRNFGNEQSRTKRQDVKDAYKTLKDKESSHIRDRSKQYCDGADTKLKRSDAKEKDVMKDALEETRPFTSPLSSIIKNEPPPKDYDESQKNFAESSFREYSERNKKIKHTHQVPAPLQETPKQYIDPADPQSRQYAPTMKKPKTNKLHDSMSKLPQNDLNLGKTFSDSSRLRHSFTNDEGSSKDTKESVNNCVEAPCTSDGNDLKNKVTELNSVLIPSVRLDDPVLIKKVTCDMKWPDEDIGSSSKKKDPLDKCKGLLENNSLYLSKRKKNDCKEMVLNPSKDDNLEKVVCSQYDEVNKSSSQHKVIQEKVIKESLEILSASPKFKGNSSGSEDLCISNDKCHKDDQRQCSTFSKDHQELEASNKCHKQIILYNKTNVNNASDFDRFKPLQPISSVDNSIRPVSPKFSDSHELKGDGKTTSNKENVPKQSVEEPQNLVDEESIKNNLLADLELSDSDDDSTLDALFLSTDKSERPLESQDKRMGDCNPIVNHPEDSKEQPPSDIIPTSVEVFTYAGEEKNRSPSIENRKVSRKKLNALLFDDSESDHSDGSDCLTETPSSSKKADSSSVLEDSKNSQGSHSNLLSPEGANSFSTTIDMNNQSGEDYLFRGAGSSFTASHEASPPRTLKRVNTEELENMITSRQDLMKQLIDEEKLCKEKLSKVYMISPVKYFEDKSADSKEPGEISDDSGEEKESIPNYSTPMEKVPATPKSNKINFNSTAGIASILRDDLVRTAHVGPSSGIISTPPSGAIYSARKRKQISSESTPVRRSPRKHPRSIHPSSNSGSKKIKENPSDKKSSAFAKTSRYLFGDDEEEKSNPHKDVRRSRRSIKICK